MDERTSAEVERVMLHIGDARDRAQRAAKELRRSGGTPSAVAALERTHRDLERSYRELSQATLHAPPDAPLQLAV